jgi:hypothetical protein
MNFRLNDRCNGDSDEVSASGKETMVGYLMMGFKFGRNGSSRKEVILMDGDTQLTSPDIVIIAWKNKST